ncbi:DNA helicase RecD [Streptomyces sp. WAC05374]|uniref:helix-hairpin-helix domain-containing protein n=1 Tax=Streptomyces sp. WAC05374 TaxID=2487420 RepID=UPI000F879FEA|nr:helix-hairpin-helix domain-containing protein [Streptomyces sp. WAC05374]RST14293.1 DNA helicase RecD [Streptomyces sp. WAC05374]TDF36783.1 DNA helicase RecD [Streptomyces sp. WAC05374]TDF45789.1 DNA helicase RecD [Streptomyces sp. WAC05374]TDF49478.1 DNA helicase RecD [Streptomyces sp. WAC05374]
MTALPRGETPGPSADDQDDAASAAGPAAADGAEPDGPAPVPAPEEAPAPAGDGADADATREGEGDGTPSEAAAELAAQRELRARIEQRKAEKAGPIEAGAKLSGTAADLLAAVRAVESGEASGTAFFGSPAPAPRKAAPEPVAPARPSVAAEPVPSARTAAPETVAAVRAVLSQGGAPEALAGGVATELGETAADALREDPWRLLSVSGVRPEQADGFARALLGPEAGPGDERRTVALIGWLLQRAALAGHTALDAAQVRAALAERSVPEPEEAVRHAIAEGAVLVFHDGLDEHESAHEHEDDEQQGQEEAGDAGPVPVLLGLDRYALAEESLADGLARLARTGPDARWKDAPPSELTRAVAEHGLVAHTGGEAARGEAVALTETARGLGLRAAVAVHTENGRRRLGPDVAAVTVAGLLAGTGGPGRDEDGAFALDLLVVLDAPQLDVETAAMLVESLADGCRLVLSGDPGVLWSAGAGRVFADVLAARACPHVASRTPDPGPIGELVSGIGIGELNQVEAPGKEVVIVPVRDAGEAVHRTVQLVADSVPRAIGVPAEQTQVITVGHGGSAGTRALNAALKQRLNPGPGRFGGYDPGDRVAYAPSPGRTVPGTVLSADPEGLRLDCEGDPVLVPKDLVGTALRHGWALTAHQAVAMRWPAVVVVLPGDAADALDRAWVQTAFGRGERHLSVVHGVDQALPRAVAEKLPRPRTTRLRALLEALLATPDD